MFFLLFFLLVLLIFHLLRKNYEYWSKRGVPGPPPKYIVGNIWQSLILRKSLSTLYNEIYNNFPGENCVGIYRGLTPVLLVRNPDLVKDVLIGNFANFQDNDFNVDKEIDPIIGRNPFFLKGQLWRTARSQLTPCFTSGKMRALFPGLQEMSGKFVEFIGQNRSFEAKELCTSLTLNNVANCAFGVEGKCFEEADSEFKQMADEFLAPNSWVVKLTFLMSVLPPQLSNMLRFKFVSKQIDRKLTDIVAEVLEYRKANNIVQQDFLQSLAQLKQDSNGKFTDVDIVAHAAAFFADGYETSSIVMSFLLYELARNPLVQSKLRQEVQKKFSGQYEDIQEMEYLEGCFCENLRKNPVLLTMVKVCTQSFQTGNVDIEKGTRIILPVGAIQNDAKYFQNPDEFIPERFMGENRKKIAKGTYFPFGDGPRVCLGQRFGVLQIKLGIVNLIRNFQLRVNKKTQEPIQLNPVHFLASPIGGLWIDFERI